MRYGPLRELVEGQSKLTQVHLKITPWRLQLPSRETCACFACFLLCKSLKAQHLATGGHSTAVVSYYQRCKYGYVNKVSKLWAFQSIDASGVKLLARPCERVESCMDTKHVSNWKGAVSKVELLPGNEKEKTSFVFLRRGKDNQRSSPNPGFGCGEGGWAGAKLDALPSSDLNVAATPNERPS